jgi:Cdc6-like AAA superfamily ATPase
MAYVARFPFLLQSDELLQTTLTGAGWKKSGVFSNQDGSLRLETREEVRVAAWRDPSLIFPKHLTQAQKRDTMASFGISPELDSLLPLALETQRLNAALEWRLKGDCLFTSLSPSKKSSNAATATASQVGNSQNTTNSSPATKKRPVLDSQFKDYLLQHGWVHQHAMFAFPQQWWHSLRGYFAPWWSRQDPPVLGKDFFFDNRDAYYFQETHGTYAKEARAIASQPGSDWTDMSSDGAARVMAQFNECWALLWDLLKGTGWTKRVITGNLYKDLLNSNVIYIPHWRGVLKDVDEASLQTFDKDRDFFADKEGIMAHVKEHGNASPESNGNTAAAVTITAAIATAPSSSSSSSTSQTSQGKKREREKSGGQNEETSNDELDLDGGKGEKEKEGSMRRTKGKTSKKGSTSDTATIASESAPASAAVSAPVSVHVPAPVAPVVPDRTVAISFQLAGQMLAPGFRPGSLPGRSRDFNKLVKKMANALLGNQGESLYVCGSCGIGKTLTTNNAIASLQDRISEDFSSSDSSAIEAGIGVEDTAYLLTAPVPSFQVVRVIGTALPTPYHTLAYDLGLASEGQPINEEAATKAVTARLSAPEASRSKKAQAPAGMVIVFVDEVDKAPKRFVQRLYAIAAQEGSRLFFVGLANSVDFPRSLSSILPDMIVFEGYSVNEIKDILVDRCCGLYEDRAMQILMMKYAGSGDIRMAISMAFRCIEYAYSELSSEERQESTKAIVKVKHTMKIFNEAGMGPSQIPGFIDKLTTDSRTLLVAMAIHNPNEELMNVPRMHEHYNTYAAQVRIPRKTQDDIRTLVHVLMSYSLIAGSKESFGGKREPDKVLYRLIAKLHDILRAPKLEQLHKEQLEIERSTRERIRERALL